MPRRTKVLLATLLAPLLAIAGGSTSSADAPKPPTWTWPGIAVTIPTAIPTSIPTLPPLVAPPPAPDTSVPSFPRGASFLDPMRYAKILTAFAPSMGKLPASADMSADFPPPG